MLKPRKSTIKWLFKNSKSIAFPVLLLTALGTLLSYISVEFAMASRKLLDSATGVGTDSFFECIIFIAALVGVQLVLESIYNIYAVRVVSANKNRLQKKLFSDIMTRDYSRITAFHSGELINRLTQDITAVNSNIIEIVPSVVTLLTGVVFSFVAMMKLDLALSLICLSLGPVVFVLAALYGKKVKKLHSRCLESDGKTRSFMQECIQNIMAVKAFCSEEKAAKHSAHLQKTNYKLNMKRGYISVAVNILYYLALTAAYYFAVAWCAYKIKAGVMTVGSFAAIIQLVSYIQTPFRDISGTISQFFAACASAERIMEIEALESDVTTEKPPKDFSCIKAEGVSFSYGDEDILKNASFEISKGDIAVIGGGSGKGKTTMFKLMLGMIKAQNGEVCIYNNEEKIPVSAQTRGLFAYVPQGNMIVSGTIAKNIAFFDDNPDMDKICKAARIACIYDYIETLPDKMDTFVGEKGLGLSEGQVQRIAIARALYYDLPVILLDEATSALDEETEALILKNIKNLKDKTCIIISHRRAAFDIATRRFTLENGMLI